MIRKLGYLSLLERWMVGVVLGIALLIECAKAQQSLDGRYFGGKKVRAIYYDENRFGRQDFGN